jgi:uncharacterized protein YqjF (DUF2071 family)
MDFRRLLTRDLFSGKVIDCRSKRRTAYRYLVWEARAFGGCNRDCPLVVDHGQRHEALGALSDGLNWTCVQTTKGLLKPNVAA